MSFFDSKEEIIKIELTPHGKYLLSKGKFNPKYYAFFDDDILYDSRYANFSESQNSTSNRILSETPFCKPQGNYSSAQLRKNNQYKIIFTEDGELQDHTVLSPNTGYSIGSCDINSDYTPAWHISCLTNNISSSSDLYLNSSGSYSGKIPQINLKTSSIQLHSTDNTDNLEENEALFAIVSSDQKPFIVSSFEDIQTVFSILEKNVVDKKENFKIEVYKQKGEDEKDWEQLYFYKKPTNIQNDILLDNYLYEETIGRTPDITNVEYYFDIFVDEEIINANIDKTIVSQIYKSPIDDSDKPFGDKC